MVSCRVVDRRPELDPSAAGEQPHRRVASPSASGNSSRPAGRLARPRLDLGDDRTDATTCAVARSLRHTPRRRPDRSCRGRRCRPRPRGGGGFEARAGRLVEQRERPVGAASTRIRSLSIVRPSCGSWPAVGSGVSTTERAQKPSSSTSGRLHARGASIEATPAVGEEVDDSHAGRPVIDAETARALAARACRAIVRSELLVADEHVTVDLVARATADRVVRVAAKQLSPREPEVGDRERLARRRACAARPASRRTSSRRSARSLACLRYSRAELTPRSTFWRRLPEQLARRMPADVDGTDGAPRSRQKLAIVKRVPGKRRSSSAHSAGSSRRTGRWS